MQKYLAQAKENQGSPSSITLADKLDSPQVKVPGSPRKPLTPLQHKLEKKLENGKDGKATSSPALITPLPLDVNVLKSGFCIGVPSPKPSAPSTPGSPLRKVQSGFVTKKKHQGTLESVAQAESTDLDLITGQIAPLDYWKELAEQRRVALEDTLKENERLTEKVAFLEADNRNLTEMLEDAKTLAEMINAMSEADDSGIVRDSTFNTSTD